MQTFYECNRMRLQFALCLCRDLHIDWRSSKIRCKTRQVSCNIYVGQQKCRTSCGLWGRGWLQLTSVNEISRKFSQYTENAALNKHPNKQGCTASPSRQNFVCLVRSRLRCHVRRHRHARNKGKFGNYAFQSCRMLYEFLTFIVLNKMNLSLLKLFSFTFMWES